MMHVRTIYILLIVEINDSWGRSDQHAMKSRGDRLMSDERQAMGDKQLTVQ
jgi:hypothetical protein